MKHHIYLIILLLILGANLVAQSSNEELIFEMGTEMDTIIFDENLCETAKNIARSDIENGRYAAFLHGLDGDNSLTFERLMIRKYGVYAYHTGLCMGDEFMSCYSEISIPLIKERLGEDIFERTNLEAIELDKEGKGDREAFYKNGQSEFVKLFHCELENEWLKQYKSKKDRPTFLLTLKVDKEGIIFDSNIESFEDEKVTKEVNRIIEILPLLQPATEDGKTIEGEISFFLDLHKKWKRCR